MSRERVAPEKDPRGLGGWDPCVSCGVPTLRQGGGFRFAVDREPNPDGRGWLCMSCAYERGGLECDHCGEGIALDDEVRTPDRGKGFHNYHAECYNRDKHGPAEYGAEEEEEERRTCPECGSKNAHEDPSSGAFVCWCDEEGKASARRKNNNKA